ncbi:MAG: diiron oxygenase [Gammaproteobacteria bacterium]|nr:diiron oxygenase [Gammaproteobacteria bacterium]
MHESRSTSTGLLEQLSRNSTPYHDPLSTVGWDDLDRKSFWLPEPAVSLYGVESYMALPVERRRILSHYEFLNFIAAGLWLEGVFMERISRSLRRPPDDLARGAYRLHELREEAGHSLMFLELMRRTAMTLPSRRFWRFNLGNVLGRYAPLQSAAFWAAVLIGEEVPDRMNRYIRKYRDQICPAIYDMVSAHVIDEARHIAHARDTLEGKLQTLPGWRLALYRPVIETAFRQFVAAFYFPGPEVYELAGLKPGTRWAKAARANPHRIRFVDDNVGSTLRALKEKGIALDWK